MFVAYKMSDVHAVFGWPHLQARRNFLKSVLVFKCINGLEPIYLLGEFKHAHQIHAYHTRQRDLLRPPLVRTIKYHGSFRINDAHAYNSLPSEIRLVSSASEHSFFDLLYDLLNSTVVSVICCIEFYS